MVPINYSVRSLFVRKATTIATLLGVALVVFVLASSQMLSAGIERTMGLSGSPDKAIVLRKGSDAELSSNIENRLVGIVKSAPGVKQSAQGAPLGAGELVVVITADLAAEEGRVANVLVRGVPEESLALRPEIRVVAGRPPQPGTNEVMIGQRLVGRYRGLTLGQSFELNKNRPAQVVGLFESGGSSFESEVWADLDTLRAAFGREGLVSSVTVQLASAASFDAFEDAVERDKQLGLEAVREDLHYEKQSEGTAIFVSALGSAIVFFFSLGAMIGAMITMYAAVANRKREIGTMRALGFSRTSILSAFLLESFLLALLGGALGAAASLSMQWVRFSMMNFATWSEVTFSFHPTPGILTMSLVVGGLMGILGGFFPALKAAQTSPLAAMRD
jgi:putative ABC transport system permease protein